MIKLIFGGTVIHNPRQLIVFKIMYFTEKTSKRKGSNEQSVTYLFLMSMDFIF